MVRVVKILEVGETETTAKVIFAFNVKPQRLEYFKNQLRNNENIKVEKEIKTIEKRPER